MFLISAALMFAMQTAPMPDKVVLTISPGRKCRLFVDGVETSDTEFRERAKAWQGDNGPQIHFRPDVNARYACVDHALTLVKAADLRKLGFVGNEMYVAEKPQ